MIIFVSLETKHCFMTISSTLTALSIVLASLTTTSSADTFTPTTDTLSTSVVTGSRYSVLRDRVASPVSVVGRSAIAASDAGTVLPALLERIPGLFVTSRGLSGYGVSGGAAGAISLRGFGAAAGRVAILIDGHPQFESIYGHPVPDEYLAGNAAKVEVSRGCASLLYGSGAMGGAINILTRKPVADGNILEFKALGGSYGTARASFYDAYRKGRLSASASLNYERSDGHRDNSAFNSLGGMLNFGYEFSPVWKASARFSYTDARSENPGTVSAPMYEAWARIRRGMAGISIENSSDKMSGSVDIYYNYGYHLINDGHTAQQAAQKYLFNGTDFTAGVTAYETVSIFEGNRLTAGIDLMQFGGHAYRNPETEVYADHRRLHEEAVYVYDNQSFGSLTLSAGLRLDNHSLCGPQLIPQLGASWTPIPQAYVKASAAKGFRVPNMKELYMYMVANEELKPEDAWSYDLTFGGHLLDGALNIEASAYYMTGSNIIEVNIVDGKKQNRNVGEFSNFGADLSADWKICKNLSVNANYSFLNMSKIYTGAPRHKAWLGADYRLGKFTANLGAMAIGGLYLTTGDSPRTSDYIDLRLRLSYSLSKSLKVFAHGYNLLNQNYETMDGFPEAGASVLAGLSLSL